MEVIQNLSAMEILDSRGRPTVYCSCTLSSGATAAVSVPSGASTGTAEALELRDGEKGRFKGLGCRKAVANVVGPIQSAIKGRELSQGDLDRALIELDGTPNKSKLGANAILAVSLAFARAVAVERNVPLYAHFASILDDKPRTLPRLTVNLFSGGKHAGGQVPIQDVLVVPASASTISRGLEMVYAVYQAAAELCLSRYGMRALTADEGGLAPPFRSAEDMLANAVDAIEAAGLEPGEDVAIAVDVASTHFHQEDRYWLGEAGLDAAGMIATLERWVKTFPIVSVEDGLYEEDWPNWPALKQAIGARALVLGDDFLCTNPARIRRAIGANAANALLLKVNQIGTLTEAAEACKLARDAGWRVTISARSGETEDNWLADLSVGWSGDQIKVGSITQSERLAKYNRLLQIEAETRFPVIDWPGGRT
jgi:enolase